MSRDPVCGKEVDSLRARAVGIWGGRTYYFCSPEHKAEFAREPAKFGEHGAREPTLQGAAPTGRSSTPVPAKPQTPARGARPAESTTADRASPAKGVMVSPAPASTSIATSHVESHDGHELDSDSAITPARSPLRLVLVVLALVAIAAAVVLFARR